MTKKLTTLFFTTIRRAARLQSKALKRIGKAARKTARKRPRKTVGAPARNGAPRLAAAHAATLAQVAGKGSWQNFVHATSPTRTELLGRLAYSLYRPGGGPVAGMPLVIMLHGCQQTPADLALGSRMNRLAEQERFVVAYPQQVRRVQSMRCWRWFQPTEGEGLSEADAIADLARVLVRKYGLDPARVYVAGMSAGAGMAAMVAIRHPRFFAAVAMHSGAVVGDAHDAAGGVRTMRRGSSGDPSGLLGPVAIGAMPAGGIPAIILHGRRDRVVSEHNAIQLAQQFCFLNGVGTERVSVLGKGTHREYVRHDHPRNGRSTVRLCLFREVGHAWSGGDGRLKFHSAKGPAASLLIWRFFAAHRRAPG